MTPPGRASLLAVMLLVSLNASAQENATTPPPLPAEELEDGTPALIHRVVFKDGQVLRGRLVSQSVTEVLLELSGGGVLEIPGALVGSVEPEHPLMVRRGVPQSYAATNRTRYFYSPSAHMLRKGEAYFSQKELIFSSFAYGVSDNFSILAGTVAPAWFLGVEGFNGIFGLKAGAPVSDGIRVAAGLETLVLPGVGSQGPAALPLTGVGAGLLFGSVTFGGFEHHVTLSVGKPILFSLGDAKVQSLDLISTVSGHRTVHRNIGLMTEHWFVVSSFAEGELLTAHAFGLRFFGEQLAADLGFIWVGHRNARQFEFLSAVPVPWLDFTWNFDFSGR